MKRTNRRQILTALGTIPLLGAAGSAAKADPQDAPTGAELVTPADRREHARLKALNLDDPTTAATRSQMPAAKIANLMVGRLICGSNLISMNMHARDLSYVSDLAAHYNTQERVFMTLKLCEEHGINTIVLKDHNFTRFKLSRYWTEWGGKMEWIADVITTDIDKYERRLVDHLDLGAWAAYLWGGASDMWYHENKQKNIIKAYEIMRRYEIPVGIAAHRLAPIAFCEKEGIVPDFYFLTLHHDRYWSAHPKQNRRFIEMYQPNSPEHAKYHDNMFCHEHAKTAEFMQDVKVPWIAFKVLAAGAIGPKDGIEYAFTGGADFICLGMFDWQVREDVELTKAAVAKAKNRKRPWTT